MFTKSEHPKRKSKLLHYEESLRSTFSSLSRIISELPGDSLKTKAYQKRETLYREGAPIEGIYWLQSGEAKVYKTGPEGRDHILRLAYAGDMLGLESLFCTPEAAASSAEMLENGYVSFLSRQVLEEAIILKPDLAMRLMRALATQVVFSDEERVDLAQNSVRERMARLLASLCQNHGVAHELGIQVDLNFSREELAEMIGTASETAMRLIKDFREEKIISVEGRRIWVLDPDSLVRLARLETLEALEAKASQSGLNNPPTDGSAQALGLR